MAVTVRRIAASSSEHSPCPPSKAAASGSPPARKQTSRCVQSPASNTIPYPKRAPRPFRTIPALAEIHPTGKFAHNLNIQVPQAVRLQRRNPSQRLNQFHGRTFTYSPSPLRRSSSPVSGRFPTGSASHFGPPTAPEKLRPPCGKRPASRQEAASQPHQSPRPQSEIPQLKLVIKFLSRFPQNRRRRPRHFRPDAISRSSTMVFS